MIHWRLLPLLTRTFAMALVLSLSSPLEACTPWSALGVSSSVVGTNLQLNFIGNTGWNCCYRVQIEVVCANQGFTGAFNYQSNQICKNGGGASSSQNSLSTAYQPVNIDLTQWCPGTQLKWRARETNTDLGQGNGPYSATFNVTVPGVAIPLAASVVAAPPSVCAGQCFTLTASAVGGCGNYTYSWSQGGAGVTANVCPAVQTTYTVTATSTGSCGAATATATASVTVNIDPPPVAGVAAAAPSPVCSGANTTLTLAGYTGTIQWQSGPASGGPFVDIAGATADNYVFGPVTADTYFQAVVSNTCTSVNSNVANVLLQIPPATNFTSSTVCANAPTVFTDQTLQPGTITGWVWDFGDGSGPSNVQNPSHQYPAAGAFNATLTTTFNTGCVGTITLPVNVMPMPTANFNFVLACANANSALNDLSAVAAPSNITQWAWDIGNNTSVEYNSQNASHSFGIGGTYNVSLTVTTNSGCTGSVVLPVDAAPIPVSNFSATTVCIGAANVFTDQSTVASGTINAWSWDFGDGNLAATQNPTNTYAAAGIYNTTLTVTTNNGCIHAFTDQVFVTDLPTADFSFAQGCSGVQTPFTDLSVDVAGIAQWAWDFGGLGVSSAPNPQFLFPTDGNFNVQLTVTSLGGCVQSVTYPVAVFPNPTANFSATSVCAQTATTLTDLSVVNAPSNIAGWAWDIDLDGTPDYITQNPSHTFAVGGGYTVGLGVVTNDGCTDAVVLPVTSYPVPVADLSGTSVCLGFPSDLTDLSTVASGAIVQWNWLLGPLVSNVQNPQVIFPTTGNQVIDLTVTTDQGCTDNATGNVSVFVLPTAAFNFVDVCLVDPAVFNSISSVPNGSITQYDWDFGNGSTYSGQVPPSQLYPAAGPYNITLNVLTNNGCTDTDQQSITVSPIPTPDFSFTTVCRPFATTFTDLSTVTNGNTIATWDWDLGNQQQSAVQNPSHTYSVYGSYSVTLTVTSNNGCVAQITNSPVVIHPDPVAEFSPILSNCLYDTTSFINLSTIDNQPFDDIVSWSWAFGDGAVSAIKDTAHHYTVPGIYAAQLAVETNNGCQDTVLYNVEIFPLPVPDFAADTTKGCQPFQANFNDLSTIAAPYSVIGWEWTFGDGSSSVSAQYPTHLYNDVNMDPMSFGTYSVGLTVTSANGCVSDTMFVDYMNAYPKPNALFTVNRPVADILDPTFKFTDNSSPNVTDWFWQFGDGSTANEQHPTHQYTDTIEYGIIQLVTTDYGCMDTARFSVEVIPVFTFYVPNTFTPNEDANNPTWGGYGTGFKTYEAKVFNRWGELIFESYDIENRWDGTYKSKQIQAGVYNYIVAVYNVLGELHHYQGNVNIVR